ASSNTMVNRNLPAACPTHSKVGVLELDLSGPTSHVILGMKKGEIKATLSDMFLGEAEPAETIIDLSPKFDLKKGGLFFCPASNKIEDMLRLLKSGLEVSVFKVTLQNGGENGKLDC